MARRRQHRRPKRFWLWLYYPASLDPSPALKPWARWGSVTGSGSGAGVSDISWEHATLAGAKTKAQKMHSLLAGVSHQIEIVDTGVDGWDHIKVLSIGKAPRRVYAPKRKSAHVSKRRRTSKRRSSKR